MTINPVNEPEESTGPPESPGKEGESPMVMCPMANMCQGMMEKPNASIFPTVAGMVFIALGILIILAPSVLVWLAAIVFVAIGVIMMVFANFIRRGGGRFGGMGMHSHS